MILKSVSGNVLFESQAATIREAVERAVQSQASLRGVNLRRVNLDGIQLKGAQMQGACLWGASLKGAELLGCDLSEADLRLGQLQGVNIAYSCLQEADLRGAKVRNMTVTQADLSHAIFSDPAFFDLDLYVTKQLTQTVFIAFGETDYMVEEWLYQKIRWGDILSYAIYQLFNPLLTIFRHKAAHVNYLT